MTDVKTQIEAGKFIEAEELLRECSELGPDQARRGRLKDLIADMYLAWAKDMLDKYNQTGAEEKLNLVLAARPDDGEAVGMMLKLWEDVPSRQGKVLEVYEAMLARNPADTVLRRKVADIYYENDRVHDSLVHYLKLYEQTPDPKGSTLEQRLLLNLERVHGEYAVKGDFENAIAYAKRQEEINRNTLDPQTIIYYQYLKKSDATAPDDLEGQLEIARWAEQGGLTTEALNKFKYVLERDGSNEKALAGLERHALDLVDAARRHFNKKEYFMAKALAEKVERDFPRSEEAKLRAEQLVASSNIEIERVARTRREQALQYVDRGDTFFQQALVFYRDIQDMTRTGTRIGNPFNDARRFFSLAIEAYENALRLDPTLKNDPSSLVGPNMAQARAYMARLNQPLRPRRSLNRSDPTLRFR